MLHNAFNGKCAERRGSQPSLSQINEETQGDTSDKTESQSYCFGTSFTEGATNNRYGDRVGVGENYEGPTVHHPVQQY